MLENVRIVLVEPSHPGNIGGACRAMKTMGLRDLVVVNPERFPDPQAEWRAAGAQDVLDGLRLMDSVADAVADCHWIVGTSTRNRKIPWPHGSVAEVAEQIVQRFGGSKTNPTQPPPQVAILFGRETNGLSNDELQQCHQHMQIPANPDYPSLNLAMAVQVVTYELYKHSQLHSLETPEWDRELATGAQTQGVVEQTQALLEELGFIDAKAPGQSMTRLRRLLLRVQPDVTEVQMLRGILKQLRRRIGG